MSTTQQPNENEARDRTENRNENINQTAIQTEIQNQIESENGHEIQNGSENDIQDEDEIQAFMTEVPVTVENSVSITSPKTKSKVAKIMIRIKKISPEKFLVRFLFDDLCPHHLVSVWIHPTPTK